VSQNLGDTLDTVAFANTSEYPVFGEKVGTLYWWGCFGREFGKLFVWFSLRYASDWVERQGTKWFILCGNGRSVMRQTISLVSVAFLLGGILTIGSCAVAEQAELKIGDKAPDWKNLVGVDDKQHSLSDYAEAKLIVLVFTCNHCPVAKAYEDRLVALQKDYKEKKVQVIALNVNNIPEDRLDQMKVRAKEKGFNFPYLYDSSQKSGHAYGAKVTPHVFVLDSERKVAYVGAIDDNIDPSKVKRHYLREALDALLAGKTPETPVTKAFGCTIKYE